MKAVLIRAFGPPDVMEIEETGIPPIADDEVLVRVRYSSVNPVDWKIRNGSLRLLTGSRFPMPLGFDVTGEVVETGRSASPFKKGDRVFGMLSFRQRGSYADYARIKKDSIVTIPEGVKLREAGTVPLAALTAYQALHHKGRIRQGQSVLINGASGGVGSFAVQIAKAAGAQVAAVCGPTNIELVRSLGADTVMDYTKESPCDMVDSFDIVFDAVGKLAFFSIRKALRRRGRYITTLPDNPSNIMAFFITPLLSLFGYRGRAAIINVLPSGPDLKALARLLEQRKLVPQIDRIYRLEEIAEAHAYSETGHARGKIVIEIS